MTVGRTTIVCYVLVLFFRHMVSCFMSNQPDSNLLSDMKPELVYPSVIYKRNDGKYPRKIFYLLNTVQDSYLLKLRKNSNLVSLGCDVNYWDRGESTRRRSNEDCYYQGRIEGRRASRIIVSVCDGLDGIINDGSFTYYITPTNLSRRTSPRNGFKPADVRGHLLYNLTEGSNSHGKTLSCNSTEDKVLDVFFQDFRRSPAKTRSNVGNARRVRRERQRVPTFSFAGTRNVELYLVNDHSVYEYYDRNVSLLEHRSKLIANILDDRLRPLKIRVILVGVEVWSEKDRIPISDSSFETLLDFMKYRYAQINRRVRNDNAHLITRKVFDHGETAGKAPMATMCSLESSAAINQDFMRNPLSVANVIAHEIGHNLGMNHDGVGCDCADHPQNKCIMGDTLDVNVRSYSFCSRKEFETNLRRNEWACLLDAPKEPELPPLCGNGFIDQGEACDCGNEEQCANAGDECCNAISCQLNADADCAAGECCSECKLVAEGTLCHSQSNECDLPEYCTGSNTECPDDVTIHNGLECPLQNGICFEGHCVVADHQCQAVFGKNATNGHVSCYKTMNSRGDELGYCKQDDNSLASCLASDAQCGKLQCYVPPNTALTRGALTTIVHLNHDVADTASYHICSSTKHTKGNDLDVVKSGTECGRNRICIDQQCVPTPKSQCPFDCYGNGICNSKRHCHCEFGWAPPYCNSSGIGGSIDSGTFVLTYSKLVSKNKMGEHSSISKPVIAIVTVASVCGITFMLALITRSCKHVFGIWTSHQWEQNKIPRGPLAELLNK